jgi:hypothetical protein
LDAGRYPEILAVCYFNMTDTPKAWGDVETPEWSITRAVFDAFCKSFSCDRPTTILKHVGQTR